MARECCPVCEYLIDNCVCKCPECGQQLDDCVCEDEIMLLSVPKSAPLVLTPETVLYITSEGGTDEMRFCHFCDAVRGGMGLNGVEITFDKDHSVLLERKRVLRAEINDRLRGMDIGQIGDCLNYLKFKQVMKGNADAS